jgi:hypothetical protein
VTIINVNNRNNRTWPRAQNESKTNATINPYPMRNAHQAHSQSTNGPVKWSCQMVLSTIMKQMAIQRSYSTRLCQHALLSNDVVRLLDNSQYGRMPNLVSAPIIRITLPHSLKKPLGKSLIQRMYFLTL